MATSANEHSRARVSDHASCYDGREQVPAQPGGEPMVLVDESWNPVQAQRKPQIHVSPQSLLASLRLPSIPRVDASPLLGRGYGAHPWSVTRPACISSEQCHEVRMPDHFADHVLYSGHQRLRSLVARRFTEITTFEGIVFAHRQAFAIGRGYRQRHLPSRVV